MIDLILQMPIPLITLCLGIIGGVALLCALDILVHIYEETEKGE